MVVSDDQTGRAGRYLCYVPFFGKLVTITARLGSKNAAHLSLVTGYIHLSYAQGPQPRELRSSLLRAAAAQGCRGACICAG